MQHTADVGRSVCTIHDSSAPRRALGRNSQSSAEDSIPLAAVKKSIIMCWQNPNCRCILGTHLSRASCSSSAHSTAPLADENAIMNRPSCTPQHICLWLANSIHPHVQSNTLDKHSASINEHPAQQANLQMPTSPSKPARRMHCKPAYCGPKMYAR